MTSKNSTKAKCGYDHVQTGIVHTLLDVSAAGLLLPVVFGIGAFPWHVMLIFTVVAAILVLLSACSRHLKIRDEGDKLSARFGPIGLFGTRIAYAKITEVEVARTNFIDGWGVHYMPWQGWTYNIHGFRCVRIRLGKKTVKLGTDEPEVLADFLRSKMEKGA